MPKKASASKRPAWNEIRRKAADFARRWKDETRESAEAQSFWNDFFAIFGIERRRFALYERSVKMISGARGRIDLFWPGKLIVEHKSAGEDLAAAFEQADRYLSGIKPHEFPRYILASDFQHFRLLDSEADDESSKEHSFALSDLPEKVNLFDFMLGEEGPRPREQDPVDIEASERIGRIHKALVERGYKNEEELGRFLVRLVFCLFGDDTGIFEKKGAFQRYIRERTEEGGLDLGQRLSEWFQVLDTPEKQRPKGMDEDFEVLPYVNGGLFAGPLRIPPFNKKTRDLLLEACEFDWSKISPAIFGALVQSLMDSGARRAKGAHYTSEESILKVIGPLFLDDLRRELDLLMRRRGTDRKGRLESFRKRLAQLTFLDPACGCGNFLVITYRELRRLEMEALEALRKEDEGMRLDVRTPYLVRVTQFYGIEKEPFPTRIAEASLWMMEHLMNREMSDAFNQAISRFPLEKKGLNICNGDALKVSWNKLLPADKCDFVLGNPPFGGANQRKGERAQQMRDMKEIGLTGGALDYVTAWFVMAGRYIRPGKGKIGLVATNSITQGAQVGQLWPILYKQCGLEIIFAHRSFAWSSEVRGAAKVHVVIIGLAKQDDAPKSARLFSYDGLKGEPLESPHASLTSYLTDGSALSQPPHLVVQESNRPLNGFPKMRKGSALTDGKNYTFTQEEKDDFLREEPGAEKFLRPFFNAEEFLEGKQSWVLSLQKATPEELRALPKVEERVKRVREWRKTRGRDATLAKANFPLRYDVDVIPEAPFLVVPRVSTENRDYVPIAWVNPPAIPSDASSLVLDADLPLFAILSSAMHNAWIRCVGGRLKSDFRYSIKIVYNTFPTPPKWEERRSSLTPLAEAVLKARGDSVLENLYNPNLMPTKLREAHQALDRKVDRMYRDKPFKTERERTEHLLVLYEKTAAPVVAAAAPKATGRAAKSRRRPRKG